MSHMNNTQLLWLAAPLAQLQQAKAQQRLPHAVLLTGQQGIGKHIFATELMHWLHCLSPSAQSACGQCEACQQMLVGSFPDHALVEPEETGKNIRVEQIRSIVEFCHHTAHQGGYRTVLINPADAMNMNAQNALLKTLEEPGERTLLLLVTHQLNQMLPTIISRCQQIKVPMPTVADGVTWLMGEGFSEADATGLLMAAGGAPLKAQQLAGTDWFLARQEILMRIANLPQAPAQLANVAKDLAGYHVVHLLTACFEWLAAAIKWQHGIKANVDSALVPAFEAFATLPQARLFEVQQAVLRALKLAQTGANPNVEMLYEQILMVLIGVPVPRDIVAAY